MRKDREAAGYHEVFGVELRRVTSILDRVKRFGLDEWQASCALDYLIGEILEPLRKEWMTVQQLKETDLELTRKTAMGESRRIMKAKQGFGRRAHEVIHDYYKAGQDRNLIGGTIRMEPELKLALMAFCKWEDEYDVQMTHAERLVFSFSKKYSGTLDLEATVVLPNENAGDPPPRRLYIFDFKTGSPEPTQVMQLAAYVVAVEEMERRQVDGAGLVFLDPATGRPRAKLFERSDLYIPFMMFERLKGFVDLEDEWRHGHQEFNGGPLEGQPTTPPAGDGTPASPEPAGPPIFE